MKKHQAFLFAVLGALSLSCLAACGGKAPEPEEEKPLEIGDTVKEWKSDKDFNKLPIAAPADSGSLKGEATITDDIGHDDSCSLEFDFQASANGGYISSDAVEDLYFTEDDAKNGDIISLYVYLPAEHNVASLQLELHSSAYSSGWNGSSEDVIEGTKLAIDETKEEKWFRLEQSFDTLYTFGSVRLKFTPKEADKNVKFYVDDIHIMYGAETVETGYVSVEDECLYRTYEDNFIVGTCMSASMLRNTTLRKIAKEQFNSITAENEGKPEQVLDQAECQKLAKDDQGAVAIKITPFEKIYDWCEANHIKVRHHTFVWHQQTPDWFFNEGYTNNGKRVSRDTMLARLDSFFEAMIEALDDRWPELVYALDVVNEAIPEVDEVRSGNWMNTVGEDYIYQAFVAAHRHKKDYMDLYYNDYSFEQTQWGGADRCRSAVNKILKRAIDEKIIDGVGIQSHIEFTDVDTVLEDCRTIYGAGIKCQITELDINCKGSSEFEAQKAAYKKLVEGVLRGNEEGTMDVNAIIVWGITDNLSWHSSNSPLMFNADYSKKPAYYGFLEALEYY